MDAAAAARRWVEAWQAAWPAADPDELQGVYADDALFFSHPFRAGEAPAAYAAWAFADQTAAECRFGEPVVDSDRAAVDWWAVVTSRDGSVETLAGTSLLRFDREGRVLEQRDAWAAHDGRVELPRWAR